MFEREITRCSTCLANTFSVDDARALKEEGLGMISVGKTLFEAFEILDHFKAYEFLTEHTDQPLTEK